MIPEKRKLFFSFHCVKVHDSSFRTNHVCGNLRTSLQTALAGE
jgi:hypothetical protein